MSSNTKKDLLLICNRFPFGHGETFLANEFPHLHENFRKIVILVRTDATIQTRVVPDDVSILKISPKSSSKIKLSALLFKYMSLLFVLLKEEINAISSVYGDKLNTKQIKQMWHDAVKAIELASFIKKNILKELSNNAVIYSYWQNSATVAALLVRKEFPGHKVICRAHRGDLYFYAQEIHYLSYRRFISENIDKLFFISDDGMKYQTQLLKKSYAGFVVSRLGVKKERELIPKKKLGKRTIVSCSNIIPVKRIELIVKALALVEEIEIKWIHFGGGYLEDSVKDTAKQMLSSKTNIKYCFKGKTDNKVIHRFYAENQIDLFINVSESEGIPVSIMEAINYGIPVLATDVGGVGEIITEAFGKLIKKNLSPAELANHIKTFFENSPQSLDTYSKKAREFGRDNYSSEKNYNDFIKQIQTI